MRNVSAALAASILGAQIFAAVPGVESLGKLRQDRVDDRGRIDYVCTLKADTQTYEVKVSLDREAGRLGAALEYPLAYEKGSRLRITGAMTTTEEKIEGKPTKTIYTLVGGTGYYFHLTYTDGAELPEFSFGIGLKGYACR